MLEHAELERVARAERAELARLAKRDAREASLEVDRLQRRVRALHASLSRFLAPFDPRGLLRGRSSLNPFFLLLFPSSWLQVAEPDAPPALAKLLPESRERAARLKTRAIALLEQVRRDEREAKSSLAQKRGEIKLTRVASNQIKRTEVGDRLGEHPGGGGRGEG